ncbi:hypothetical protein KC722_00720 [Candidatus Kaiserbacteria bacterium]|nr:hypothetical protein [Candidatus Kaiserbacteria bacterium]MCB9811772.1 hypothetical protein [Candidatus Nomurabacteria bacterium]
MRKTGTFGYHLNCSIPHHVPQGEFAEGMPVIVFPKDRKDVTVGKTYEYTSVLTKQATYVIDGVVYRVAHAFIGQCVTGEEGHAVDVILYNPRDALSSRLGDRVDADKLAAFMEKLRA